MAIGVAKPDKPNSMECQHQQQHLDPAARINDLSHLQPNSASQSLEKKPSGLKRAFFCCTGP